MDFSAFNEPVTQAEIAEYKDSPYLNMKQTNKSMFAFMVTGGALLGIILMGVFIGMTESIGAAGPILATIFVIGCPSAAILVVRAYIRQRVVQGIRLLKFGMRNNLVVYLNVPGNAGYPGLIFQVGEQQSLSQWVSASDGSYVVGNYSYFIGSRTSRERRQINKHFLMLKLPRKLPNMVLDGTKNNLKVFGRELMSNLPATFNKDQVLSLEGDFNSYFTLYAPKEYERDALYVFTPDLMALFMDNTSQYDAEIIDDMLFVYGDGWANLYNPNVWTRFLQIKNVVGTKLINQTDYYADERVGNRAINEVATGGRRLRRGISWIAIVFGIAYAIFEIIHFLLDASSL